MFNGHINGESSTPDYLLGVEGNNIVRVRIDAGPQGQPGDDTHGVGSGGGAGDVLSTRQLTGAKSISGGGNLSADRTFELVGDLASPGASQVYGTNALGVKGWMPQGAQALTTLSYSPLTGILAYLDENGLTTSLDLSALKIDMNATGATYAAATGILTLAGDDGMVDVTVNLSALKAVNTTGSLVGDGDGVSLSLVNDNAAPGNNYFYGTDGAGVKGFQPMPTGVAAGALPGAAPALAGAAGAAVAFSREDHNHPFQGVSADAGNKIILGADGLHQFAGSGRVHATNTAVAPVAAGAPTFAEIAAAVTERDVIVYYTGDDLPASTPTYVYHVDSAGAVTLLEKPIVSANSALKVIDFATVGNVVFHTGESDVGTLADYSGPGGVLEVGGLNVASLDRTQIVIFRNSGTGTVILAPHVGLAGGLTGDTALLIGDVALILYSANGQAAHATKLGGDVPASTLWGYFTTVETVDRAGVVGANNGSGSLVVHTGGAAAIEVQAIGFALTPNHTTVGLFRNSGTGVVTFTADASLTGGLTGDTSVPVGGIAIITYSANGNAAHVNVVGASAPPSYLVETITQAAHGLSFMNAVHHNGTAWVKSQANAAATVAQAVVVAVINANSFIVAYAGAVPVTAHGLTVGEYYWLDQGAAGLLTLTQPTSGIVQPVLHVRSANQLLINIGFALSI